MISSLRLRIKKVVYRSVEVSLKRISVAFAESPEAFITRQEAKALARQAYRQAESLVEIRRLLPDLPLSGLRGWAISPDACLSIVELIKAERPKLVLELGSGVSTLAIAAAMNLWVPDGMVVSLDNSEEYAAETRLKLSEHGLKNSDVRWAPLRTTLAPDGDSYTWYDTISLEGITDIDLLVVDGPPNWSSEQARFPSLPLLRDRLSERSVIVIDDANRSSERLLAECWATQTGGTLNLINAEKGLAIVSIGREVG